MPIDNLYADQTASFLSGQNQIDVPEPRTYPSTSITSIARARWGADSGRAARRCSARRRI
ncbi:transglycosylase [Burkholderia lata]|nr:transglycosylase [Burkholderia lata]